MGACSVYVDFTPLFQAYLLYYPSPPQLPLLKKAFHLFVFVHFLTLLLLLPTTKFVLYLFYPFSIAYTTLLYALYSMEEFHDISLGRLGRRLH